MTEIIPTQLQAATYGTEDVVQRNATRPIFLMRMDLSTYLWISSGGALTVSGATWQASSLDVNQIRSSVGGGKTTSFSLVNEDLGIAQRVLDENVLWKRCHLWKVYADGDTFTQPILLMDGLISKIKLNNSRTTFTMAARELSHVLVPSMVVGPPILDHVTPRGSIIWWGVQKVVLE